MRSIRLAKPNSHLSDFGNSPKTRILLPGGVEGLFVPKSAVLRDKTTDSHQVWAIQNGKARLRIVTVGDADATQVRILTGLRAGETIAVNNQAELFDGSAVSTR